MFGAFVAEFWFRRLYGKNRWHSAWVEAGCAACECSKKELARIISEALKEMGR